MSPPTPGTFYEIREGDWFLPVRTDLFGRRVPLTTREYALLEYMARHAGRVITRADIAERVWDSSYDPLSNVIDVYVSRLRTKLAARGGHGVIRTRRGAGYVLSADNAVD